MAVKGQNSLHFATGVDNSGLQGGINQAVSMIGNMAQTIALMNPFAALVVGAITAFATIGAASFKMMREFEHAMKEVETISAATQENFQGISSAILDLSEVSVDGPKQLAEAYYQIVSAGYDGAAGLELLAVASRAATAGVTTTKVAADGITTAMNAFKLDTSQASEIADQFFTTVRLGKTTFEELSNDLSQAAPLAAAFGYSLEEVLAAVATLTKQGVPTNRAFTQIRAAIEQSAAVMGDGASKALTLQGTMQALYESAGGSNNKLKEMVGSVEAVSGILGLAGANAQEAKSDLEELGNAAGAADKAFKGMATSNQNEWAILTNKIKAGASSIGNDLVNISSGLARFLNRAFEEVETTTAKVYEQANSFNILRAAIESSNTPMDERIEMLKELQAQYPEYLQNLDFDKLANEDLHGVLGRVAGALALINDEHERRIRISGAQDAKNEVQRRKAELESLKTGAEAGFFAVIERIEQFAAKKKIKLEFDPNDSLENIQSDIRRALDPSFFDNIGLTEKSDLLRDLYQASEDARTFGMTLNEVNRELTEAEEKVQKKRLAVYDTAAGAEQIKKELEQVKTLSDLKPFEDFKFPEIADAVKFRREVVEQLDQINMAENVDSLKPFLDHEIEEIKKFAEKRKRFLNEDYEFTPATTPVDPDKAYEKMLRAKKAEYEAFNAYVNQLGREAAVIQYKNLLEQGEDYGDWLQKQLDKTEDFARRQALVLAAEGAGIKLFRPVQETISEIKPQPIVLDVEINDTSVNFIRNQITSLQREFDALPMGQKRDDLGIVIDYWKERLRVAQGGTEQEKEMFGDVFRTLNTMTYQSIRDYIEYWQQRLKTGEDGKEKEDEIMGRIADAQRQLWMKRINETQENLGRVSQILSNMGKTDMAKLVDGLQAATREIDNMFRILDKDASTEDKIFAGISAAITLTDMLVSSAYQRKKAEEEFYNSVKQQQKEYNLLLNEQLRTRRSANENVFTTDYINQVESALAALREANVEFDQSLDDLNDGLAKIGERGRVDWGNVLSGAGSGAAVGAIFGPIGAAIGGFIGAIGGFFGGRRNEPEWASLLREYPELIETAEDGQRRFNTALGQTLVSQGLVNAETAVMINNTIAWQEAIEAAREQIEGVVDTLAGALGDRLRTALVDAFESGADAAVAMGRTISDVLKNIVEQLIFDQIFAAQFKKLQEDMEKSFDIGGDRSWTDDFARFFEASKGLTDDFNEALQQARDIAEGYGFDITGQEARPGMAGAIQNITEDTANILEGYLNAVRLDVRAGLTIATQSSIYLSQISSNTLVSRDYLKSIDGRFATIEDAILEFQAQG